MKLSGLTQCILMYTDRNIPLLQVKKDHFSYEVEKTHLLQRKTYIIIRYISFILPRSRLVGYGMWDETQRRRGGGEVPNSGATHMGMSFVRTRGEANDLCV